jgi:hypothetical protein
LPAAAAVHHTMLCCAVLCCAVLCCAVLCCAVLCCAVLYCAVQATMEILFLEAAIQVLCEFVPEFWQDQHFQSFFKSMLQ